MKEMKHIKQLMGILYLSIQDLYLLLKPKEEEKIDFTNKEIVEKI